MEAWEPDTRGSHRLRWDLAEAYMYMKFQPISTTSLETASHEKGKGDGRHGSRTQDTATGIWEGPGRSLQPSATISGNDFLTRRRWTWTDKCCFELSEGFYLLCNEIV